MNQRRRTLCIMVTILAGICTASGVRADWGPGDPAKWVQLPDVNPASSLDVCVTEPLVVADDFECRSTGRITGIHIWGSWLDDWMPWAEPTDPSAGSPYAIDFRLSIYADISADQSGLGYSIPGELLWEGNFPSGSFDVVLADEFPEGWYDPNTGEYYINNHQQMWQYNFDIDPAEAFVQHGTMDNPIVYWLGVNASPGDYMAEFGWKTSLDHWNDDAVWADGYGATGDQWQDLYHPDSALGFSLDMAFVIVPEPVTLGVLLVGCSIMLGRKRSS